MPDSYKKIAAFILLTLGVATGAWMYYRNAAGALWGYLPLLLYVCLYAGVWLLATTGKDVAARKRNALSASAGLLLGLGFPGFVPIPLLLLVALVPLLYLMRELCEINASVARVFLHGFSAFVLYNLLASYWVTNTGFFAGLFAVVINSLLMCVPWLFYYWTARRSPSVAFLAFSAAWLSFEFLHYNWSLNWPWLTLGNGFMQFPELVQWYEVTGVFGGSAWILATNFLVYRVLLAQFRPASAPAAAPKYSWLAALILVPTLGSLVRYWTYDAGEGRTISVAAIQPNFEPHFEKFTVTPTARLDTFLRLSTAALAAGPVDYLVYPETSFGNIDEKRATESAGIKILRERLGGAGTKYLITGIDAYKIFAPGEALSPAVRHSNRGTNGTVAYEALNGALQVSLTDATAEFQTYRKGVFVPGAESFPFKDYLFFMEPLVNSLGGTVAGRGTQATRDPFTSEAAAVAPVICYESVFGEYFTDYIREGAQAIFVMTNDGWWDNTAGHRQHLWLSSLRAVETRRPVVRSANVGACAFIDQRGRITARTRYDEEGFLRGEMQLNDAVTWYVRLGDIIARVAVLIFVMALLVNVVRTVRPAAYPTDK